MSSSVWIFWALLSAVFAAFTAVFAKIGIEQMDSDTAIVIRTGLVLCFLVLWLFFSGKTLSVTNVSSKNWLFLSLSALATGASWLCYFRALQWGDVSKVAPIDKLSLVLVALFAFFFLGEHPSVREWCGIAMIALGVLVLAIRI